MINKLALNTFSTVLATIVTKSLDLSESLLRASEKNQYTIPIYWEDDPYLDDITYHDGEMLLPVKHRIGYADSVTQRPLTKRLSALINIDPSVIHQLPDDDNIGYHFKLHYDTDDKGKICKYHYITVSAYKGGEDLNFFYYIK